jgi:hypothetical protein
MYIDAAAFGHRLLVRHATDTEDMALRRSTVLTVLRHPWVIVDGYVVCDIPLIDGGPRPGDPFGPSELIPESLPGDVEYRTLPATWCIHYEGPGVGVTACRAGVVYDELTGGGFGCALRLPCIASNHREHGDTLAHCSLLEWPTQDELAEHERQIEAFQRDLIEHLTTGTHCIQCRQPVTRYVQVERCYYAEPCGCRQGQGEAAYFNAKIAPVSSDHPPEGWEGK